MRKNNPLFVDSTKFEGDRIGTQIQLNRILPYEDENVLVNVTSHDGEMIRVPMLTNEEDGYEAHVWLIHQKPVSYQFILERNGEKVFQSGTYKGLAQYAIIKDWEPLIEDETPLEEDIPIEQPSEAEVSAITLQSTAVQALIEKWGF